MKKKIRALIRKEVKRQIQEVLDPERFCQNCKHADAHLSSERPLLCKRVCSKPRSISKKDWCMYWESM